MKCSSPLTQGGSCGQTARFMLGSRLYCRRHASENVFLAVLAQQPLMDALKFKLLDQEEPSE